MKHLALPCLALALLLSTVTGCGDGLPEAEFTFITGSEHNYLDPQKMSWMHDSRIAECLFEPLMLLEYSDMSHKPGVAERWEISDDRLRYTFHLREDARWSNGDAVTAQDFIYAWQRALLPDLAADYSQLLFHIKGARAFFDWRSQQLAEYARIRAQGTGAAAAEAAESIWALTQDHFANTVGLSAPDARTLVVELEEPTPYFLDLVAFHTFMPVHRASVEPTARVNPDTGMLEADSGYWSDPSRLVSNGAYRLAGREFKEYLHLLANEHYWNKDAVTCESILERIIGDPQNAMLTYRSGGADFWPDLPTASSLAANLLEQERADVHSRTVAGTYFYNFNCQPTLPDGRANPLADVRVRRALSMAIDRATLVKRVTRLDQPVARSFVPPDAIPAYQPPVEQGVDLNVEAARALLAEAGYPQGQGLTGLSILYNTGYGHETIAQAIASMWQHNLGVSVTLSPAEGKSFADRLKNRDYTIARASWFGDYPDPTTWLDKMATGNGNNDAGWSNSEYDALLAKARTQSDPEQRMATLREAEAIVLEEAPMALLYQYVNIYLWDPEKVKGLEMNAWGRWDLHKVEVVEE